MMKNVFEWIYETLHIKKTISLTMLNCFIKLVNNQKTELTPRESRATGWLAHSGCYCFGVPGFLWSLAANLVSSWGWRSHWRLRSVYSEGTGRGFCWSSPAVRDSDWTAPTSRPEVPTRTRTVDYLSARGTGYPSVLAGPRLCTAWADHSLQGRSEGRDPDTRWRC